MSVHSGHADGHAFSLRQAPMDFVKPYMERLAGLFERMDHDYGQAAGRFGFVCNGCGDNCCRTLFYHHTLGEYLYLRDGIGDLPAERQSRVAARARQVLEQEERGGAFLCPLNEEERCVLYVRRPMICRLHGIPHLLRRPDGRVQQGPGCDAFHHRCGRPENGLLDRTPLYTELAGIERGLRAALGFERKLKMSIARMIVEDIAL